jgi:DNA repair photolyase
MYQHDEVGEMSLKAIRLLNDSTITCTVLSKGILPATLAQLSKENMYGITLISLDEEYRERVEPGAAPYKERLAALKVLHDQGCKTWVSIEPYPTPNLIQQELSNILQAISFVDRIIFGRTNYSKEISAYTDHRAFFNQQAQLVIKFCENNSIDYHIKDGTITKEE